MEDASRLRKLAMDRLNRLPPSRLLEALNYMDFLLGRPASMVIDKSVAPKGRLEDLLACAGIWNFEQGELEELLHDIEQSRLIELEESYGSLPD